MCKVCIKSKRLILLTPKIEILEKRLIENSFHFKICINKKHENIFFPPEWPGEAIDIYPIVIERRKSKPDILPFWTYNIINIKKKIVVGDICCKTIPDDNNEIEIGYGINSDQRRNGYASEAVLTLVSYLFNKTQVVLVRAECNISNISSAGVLQKCGFTKTGSRLDKDDGFLNIWIKSKCN